MGSELGVDMKIALSGGPMGGLEIDDVGQAFAVLTDDDGEIDWKAIAIAMSMISHVLLDIIPRVLYASVEEAISGLIAKHFNAEASEFEVTIKDKLTSTDLLRMLSLKALEMESGEMS